MQSMVHCHPRGKICTRYTVFKHQMSCHWAKQNIIQFLFHYIGDLSTYLAPLNIQCWHLLWTNIDRHVCPHIVCSMKFPPTQVDLSSSSVIWWIKRELWGKEISVEGFSLCWIYFKGETLVKSCDQPEIYYFAVYWCVSAVKGIVHASTSTNILMHLQISYPHQFQKNVY